MRLISFIPLLLFSFFILVMSLKLSDQYSRPQQGFFEESALVGKPLPKFSLPSVKKGHLGLNYNDFNNKYSLINIFASWCVACVAEHKTLMSMKNNKILPIYGIAWKDKPSDTNYWLKKYGNPYDKAVSDMNGEVVISLGITGAPESFLVNRNGIIIYHHVGPLDEYIVNNKIIPLVQ